MAFVIVVSMIGLTAAGCCMGGEGGCMNLVIWICPALSAVIIAGMATCLQIVQIAFAWQYAFPGHAAEPAANPL